MKRKIIALALVVAMVAVAVVSGTLAYLTDSDEAINVFAVGDVDIVLTEAADVKDVAGSSLSGKTVQTGNSASYKDLLPSNKIVKEVKVENVGISPAYVRVLVFMNNLDLVSASIDDVYENAPYNYTEAEVQAKYDEIFNGWGIEYSHTNESGNDDARRTIAPADVTLTDTDSTARVIAVDETFTLGIFGNEEYTLVGENNIFRDAVYDEQTHTSTAYRADGQNGYYSASMGTYEVCYAYYLYLEKGDSATLFNGLNVPAEFDAEQLKMFENLKIEVYADAIQTEGFNYDSVNGAVITDEAVIAKNAFTALNEAHPIRTLRSGNAASVTTADELAAAINAGGYITLANDLTLDADTAMLVADKKEVVLDLNGHTITSESDATGKNVNTFDVRGTMTVKNGTVTVKHTGANMGWNNSTNVFNVTAGGVLNIESAKIQNLGGSDMAFAVHLNNWGEVTLNAKNSTLSSTYMPVRVFNSGHDMNNVTLENTLIIGKYGLWVHNYTAADFGAKYDAAAVDARLNLDIYGNGNIYRTTKNPVLFGFTDSIAFDENGNQIG